MCVVSRLETQSVFVTTSSCQAPRNLVVCCLGTESHYIAPSCPETCYADQDGLELTATLLCLHLECREPNVLRWDLVIGACSPSYLGHCGRTRDCEFKVNLDNIVRPHLTSKQTHPRSPTLLWDPGNSSAFGHTPDVISWV